MSHQNDLSITFKPTPEACTVDHCHIDIVITLSGLSHDHYIVRYERRHISRTTQSLNSHQSIIKLKDFHTIAALLHNYIVD